MQGMLPNCRGGSGVAIEVPCSQLSKSGWGGEENAGLPSAKDGGRWLPKKF